MFGDSYSRYLKTYARVVSGDRVVQQDFGPRLARILGLLPTEHLIAVSLAAQDGMTDKPLRARAAFQDDVRDLLQEPR